jgi:predicted nucleotidyltransferase
VRLTYKEKEIIKSECKKIFGECEIYIFGSRIDDNKQGGDIDIYIIPKNKDNLFSKKAKLRFFLEEKLFKPVDVIISRDKNRLIEKEALKGIKL